MKWHSPLIITKAAHKSLTSRTRPRGRKQVVQSKRSTPSLALRACKLWLFGEGHA
jgi:hypothetical protein